MLTSFSNSISFQSKNTFIHLNLFSTIIKNTNLLNKTNIIPKRNYVYLNHNSFCKIKPRNNFLISFNNREKLILKTNFHSGISILHFIF